VILLQRSPSAKATLLESVSDFFALYRSRRPDVKPSEIAWRAPEVMAINLVSYVRSLRR
jgi:hypothetical protein